MTIPCVFTVFGGSATQVLSHPRFAESELSVSQIADGRTDGQECVAGGTNPLDPDTDDDLRNDGAEAAASLNPLRKDKRIYVTMQSIAVNSEQDGATFQGVELLGQFQIRYPDLTEFEFYDNPCNGEQGVCDTSACCCQSCGGGASRSCAGEAIPVNIASATFIFREGESFVLKSSELRDNDFTCGAISGNSIGTANEIIPFEVNLDLSPAVGVGGTAPNHSLTLNYLITVVN